MGRRKQPAEISASMAGWGLWIAYIVFPVSRLVVDVERFEDDADEPMAERGMGVIYTATSDFMPLRKSPNLLAREALLDQFYRPHHKRLGELVDQELAAGCDRVLILDCHSFPPTPLPYESVQIPVRPDICIGTDGFHTPAVITQALVTHFQSKGYVVGLNTPFSGSIVPLTYYQKDPRVSSVMIEINRALYLNTLTGQKSSGFMKVRGDISEAVLFLHALQKDLDLQV